MKLSKESIDRILNLHKGMNSYVLCFGGSDKAILIKNIIENSGGKLVSPKFVRKEKNTELRYAVIIFVGSINETEIFELESILARLGSRAKIIMDLTNIKLSSNRRELALSYIRKYNIGIIKGTDEELQILKKANDRLSYEKTRSDNDKGTIYLARKSSTIIVEGNRNYLTDGYNEFKVNDIGKKIIEDDTLNLIFSLLITNCITNCNNIAEMIQRVILRLIALSVIISDNVITLDKFNETNNIVNGVMNISSEVLSEKYRVCYWFKR